MTPSSSASAAPPFGSGIHFYAQESAELQRYGRSPAVPSGDAHAAAPFSDEFVYQTLLGADAMRYLTMEMTAAKSSGHPGGFMSSAEAVAALMMLGYKNIVTEVGHHAPGYYSAMFLDTSLERMGIRTVGDLAARFREQGGLLGHVTGAIPGLLSPAGPLGQGQHFALAGAYLYPRVLFPLTLGDGGLGEPYVLSALGHFVTLFPGITNYLPVLIWNGYSQEHHSIVSLKTNDEMIALWKAHGFTKVLLVDAHSFEEPGGRSTYADSTRFGLRGRMRFTRAVLEALAAGALSAMGGEHCAVLVKQLKGAGAHASGARSHNLNPGQTIETAEIRGSLESLALPPRAWALVRENFARSGGGPAAEIAVTELDTAPTPLGGLSLTEFAAGDMQVPTTAFGRLVAEVGKADPRFVVTNADGNQASGMMNINEALGIRHPTRDDLYAQRPDGRVYEPLSEDACAGFAGAVALMGGRSLWCSYESFVVNGLPVWHTVTQAMAELRRRTPSVVALFTAGAFEQGRNGWTHQRPEVEGYFAAMMRNGNVFPLFPVDANSIQAAYEWALGTANLGIPMFASKSPLPVRSSLAEARSAVERGVLTIREPSAPPDITLATVGDMVLLPTLEAAGLLALEGIAARVVAVVSPRRLFRRDDVSRRRTPDRDETFMDDAEFEHCMAGRAVLGVTGGASGMLEPVVLRVGRPFDLLCWKRGDTASSAGELFALNGLSAGDIADRAKALLARAR